MGVLRLLLERGHRVTAIIRKPVRAEALRRAGATAVIVDVYDHDLLRAAVAAAAPSAIIHQLTDLGTQDVAANARLRETGTRNLVDAAHAAGVGDCPEFG